MAEVLLVGEIKDSKELLVLLVLQVVQAVEWVLVAEVLWVEMFLV